MDPASDWVIVLDLVGSAPFLQLPSWWAESDLCLSPWWPSLCLVCIVGLPLSRPTNWRWFWLPIDRIANEPAAAFLEESENQKSS